MVPANSEQILNLTVDGKESLSLLDRLEPSHLPFLFPGMLMGDFSPVVLILAGSMLNRGENLAMRSRIAPEFVSDQLPRGFPLSLQDLAEEALSSSHVASLRDQDVENISVLIHRSPQVKLLTLDLHEDLVNMPGITQSTPLASDRAGVLRSELETPEADGLVGDDDPPLSQQIFHISKAQGESMVEPHAVADDCGRKTVASVAGFHERIVADPADRSST